MPAQESQPLPGNAVNPSHYGSGWVTPGCGGAAGMC